MFQKTYFKLLLTISLLLAGSLGVFAQTGVVRGHIDIKTADGLVPAAEITVEAYRNDVTKGKPFTTKTSKKGDFQFAGFLLGTTYSLAITGPGISPYIYPKVKAGAEDIKIEVLEGDGRTLTEEEARNAMANSLPAEGGGMTEAQKKEAEEINRKNAEITAKNEKIRKGDEIATKANADGKAALEAKNYALALAKYNEGIEAVPDFIGSTPVLMNGKIVALRQLGYLAYREGALSKDPAIRLAKYAEAKQNWADAITTFGQARAIMKDGGPGTDPNAQKFRSSLSIELMGSVAEVYRLMASGQVDTSRTEETGILYEEYIAALQDPALKLKTRQNLGDIYRNSGEFDKAIAAYKAVLEASPDNQEVMAYIGLCLVGLGTSVEPFNKEQLQEGLNYMDQYAQKVQILDTDAPNVKEFKQSVIDTVTYLKTEQNLKAQKPATPAGRKKN